MWGECLGWMPHTFLYVQNTVGYIWCFLLKSPTTWSMSMSKYKTLICHHKVTQVKWLQLKLPVPLFCGGCEVMSRCWVLKTRAEQALTMAMNSWNTPLIDLGCIFHAVLPDWEWEWMEGWRREGGDLRGSGQLLGLKVDPPGVPARVGLPL